MRVLILSNYGMGLYKFREELIKELVDKCYEVFISLPFDEYTPKLEALGCNCINTNVDRRGTNPISDLKLLCRYRKIINMVNPDIVFTYTIKPNIYGGLVCRFTGIPYLANITGLGTAVENGGLMQKFTLLLYRCGLKNAQKVFLQNSENRDFMLNHKVIKNSYDLLPGSGVNLKKYQPLEYPNGDTIDFVFISRIMKEKGIDQYLEAAKAIRGRHPETQFHICGEPEPEYIGKLKEYTDSGIVIHHGRISDISGIHRISCCTIHPTYYPEGMSNVLLESCACARPIITTDRAGCIEIVDNGVNGFVVKKQDSNDLIEKVERFLSLSWEERKNMGLAGRSKVEKEFNRDIVIEAYLKEINAL